MRYYEDIEVGARRAFGNYRVTREEALEFAGKYDPQPFHLSDEAAAKTHFKRLSVSGWMTTAMTMRMLTDAMAADEPQASVGAAGIDELRWLRPVFPGDTLRAESEVLGKAPWPGRAEMGEVRTRTSVFNQDDKPVMSFIGRILFMRREAGAD